MLRPVPQSVLVIQEKIEIGFQHSDTMITTGCTKLIKAHFLKYRDRSPWDFCWRITIEGLIISIVAAYIVHIFIASERDIVITTYPMVIAGTVLAPLIETLCLQAFPAWVARLYGGKFSAQVTASVVTFFAIHVVEGVGTGIAAGLIGGFYYAFTYVHWLGNNRWTAFWVTALSHSLHNGIIVLLALSIERL